MKCFALSLFCAIMLLSPAVHAQSGGFTMQWLKSFGGSADDFFTASVQTRDSGYALVGNSFSPDIPGHHGASDYSDVWVVRLASDGSLLWQAVYGGTDNDNGFAIRQTSDGGFVVAGSSASNDGDATGHHGGVGSNDMWLLRLDSLGHILWQRQYGGSQDEVAASLAIAGDSGFVLTGTSTSVDGDVHGHHGSTDSSDAWVLHVSSDGDIVWQRSLGGSSQDFLNTIDILPDGAIWLAGSSASNDGDATGHHGAIGSLDLWSVVLSQQGDILRQKQYGGTDEDAAFSLARFPDGSHLISGISGSSDGDVKGHIANDSTHWNIWTLKVDSLGSIVWQNSMRGIYTEVGAARPSPDGGAFIAGAMYRNDTDLASAGYTGLLALLSPKGEIESTDQFQAGDSLTVCTSLTQIADGRLFITGATATAQSAEQGYAAAFAYSLPNGSVRQRALKSGFVYPDPATVRINLIIPDAYRNRRVTLLLAGSDGSIARCVEFIPSRSPWSLNCGDLSRGAYHYILSASGDLISRGELILR